MTQIKATLIDSMGSDRSVAYESKLEELKASAYAYAEAADVAYDTYAAYVTELKLLQGA